MNKNVAIAMALLGLLMVSFSACGKGGDGPTAPSLPNSFQINSIENYGITELGLGFFAVAISFANNTNATATLIGTFHFGDGASQEVKDLTSDPNGWTIPPKTTSNAEVGRFNHYYSISGTYRVKAEFSANFKNESIKRTFEKDFQITIRE